MCRRVRCDRCGKPTFSGCGAHVEQVLEGVPKAERCQCRESTPAQAPDIQLGSEPARGVGAWLRNLFGQR